MNNPTSPRDATGHLADQAAAGADAAIRSTQKLATQALDGVANTASGLRAEVAPMINRVSEQASELAHRGADVVREKSQQLRDSAEAASTRTLGYIKEEPVKAMLIAAATGAALMALLSMTSHSRRRD
jgi:ElaB/YqjD/DUF883 family membrane-anchored ribosome-binding protein